LEDHFKSKSGRKFLSLVCPFSFCSAGFFNACFLSRWAAQGQLPKPNSTNFISDAIIAAMPGAFVERHEGTV
jgi:hypothetical protein